MKTHNLKLNIEFCDDVLRGGTYKCLKNPKVLLSLNF